jgi:hypothetical protein
MEKYLQIKKNHHYVWRFYLQQWANGKDIYYVTKKGKVACGGVRGLSRESGFYKIKPLNKVDIDFIKCWSKKSPEYLQNIHMSFLRDFISYSHVLHTISDLSIKTEEVELIEQAIQYNSLEDLYSDTEACVLPVIKSLCKGDSDILLSDKNMMALCSYMGHQFTRTKAFKEISLAAIKKNPLAIEHKDLIELIEKNWWYISFMFGINFGCDLYRSKNEDNHIFIVNDTSTPFLTSDNPLINIHSSLKTIEKGAVPENLDLYFPLSPRYAYMINNSLEYNGLSSTIDEKIVQKLNHFMLIKSDKTIYGNSREILSSVIKNAQSYDKYIN